MQENERERERERERECKGSFNAAISLSDLTEIATQLRKKPSKTHFFAAKWNSFYSEFELILKKFSKLSKMSFES